MRGARLLGVAILCILISPQRVFISLGALAIIVIRGIVGVALYHSPPALIVAVAAAGAFYFLAKKVTGVPPGYEVKDYSYAELAIDCCVLFLALFLYSRLN